MADIVSTGAPLHVHEFFKGSRWMMRVHSTDESEIMVEVDSANARWVTARFTGGSGTDNLAHFRREDFEKNARPAGAAVTKMPTEGPGAPNWREADEISTWAIAMLIRQGPLDGHRTLAGRLQREFGEWFIDGRNAAIDNAAMKAADMGRPDIRWEINHLVEPPRGGADEKRPEEVRYLCESCRCRGLNGPPATCSRCSLPIDSYLRAARGGLHGQAGMLASIVDRPGTPGDRVLSALLSVSAADTQCGDYLRALVDHEIAEARHDERAKLARDVIP